MKPLSECHLYTFVDTAYLGGRNPEIVAQQLCDGGSDLIQLRAKDLTPEQIFRLAELILPITQRAGVGLVINDHPTIARKLGAPLCHLGQEDFFDTGGNHVSEIKSQIPELKVGLSTHAPAQAERTIAAGADYIAIGPVYTTGTKPAAKPVTVELIRWAAAHVKIPWFAIGGITLKNLDEVFEAGARRICVVSAILNAPNMMRMCVEFKMRCSRFKVQG